MKIDENIYKLIVENVNQEIFVCDSEANIIFANPASIEINELDVQNVVGRNVRDLVDEGYFNESITLKVLKRKKPQNMLMTVKSGKKILEVANPVFDEDGNVMMVVCTSSDVEAVNNLLDSLEKKDAQIASLKNEVNVSNIPAAIGPATESIRELIEKASLLDVPVYISGAPGTGKSGTASAIALAGQRRSKPLMGIHCSVLSESELERELFGEEYHHNGIEYITKGKLELADNGTLVISDIEYLPENLQSKFRSFLKSKTFIRKGGVHPVVCDVRIICTTSADIYELTETGSFDKNLFYALRTISIKLLPLNERKQDLSSLARLYIEECNSKYSDRKILSNSALGVLSSYSWPGNLFEFGQVIESAYILTEGHIISGETARSVLYDDYDTSNISAVICTDIIPLKEAKKQLEEQLVKRAYDVYKTTYKAAEVLGVDQSTVSKILKKYR